MAGTIPKQAEHLFDDRNFGHLATLNEDGSPQSSTVWIELDGGAVLVNTSEGRVKHTNIAREPRVALSVHDQENPYESIAIQGRAEIVAEGEAGIEHINRFSKKYNDEDEYRYLQPGENRITIRITPERVHYMGG